MIDPGPSAFPDAGDHLPRHRLAHQEGALEIDAQGRDRNPPP